MELPADHIVHRRGQLKIFLGMAPGVGKTYTMLAEAHRRASRGEDLVVGFVETHGRDETAEMVAGLEVIPRRVVDYRGCAFEEMDTAAVLARRPEWALVDELAHTNVPGVDHAKRWQSVMDLLEAGINVISTVNIQHVESLNDEVFQITGVRVRETIPDHVLDDADEIVLVDLTPTALENRIRRGVVYEATKVDQALGGFFSTEHLVALRELALRQTAEEVDEQLKTIAGPEAGNWSGHDRVVVAVTPRPASLRLVRRGFRLAERLRGDLLCVHVRVAGATLSAAERNELDAVWEVARDLGAETHELTGEHVATELVDFAREQRATFLVLGQSVRSRFEEITRGSIVTRFMRETRGIDVVIVADPDREPPT
jgi:two-component system sensor histidine kinase KdpD